MAISALLAGCYWDEAPPTGASAEPTFAVPPEIQELLAAVEAEDAEGVQAHLILWSETQTDSGTEATLAVGKDVPLACAEGEVTELASQLPSTTFVSVLGLVGGAEMHELWFERASGSRGWGLQQHEGEWYLQPQSDACWSTGSSPSPSPE